MPNNEELQHELYEVQGKLEGLQEYLKTEKARKLLPYVRRAGWYKGEIVDLTPAQYRKLMGRAPRPAIIKEGKVPWEYSLDELATELHYPSDEALKKAVEDLVKRLREIESLKARKRYLKAELKPTPRKKKRKVALKFQRKRIKVDGKVTAHEVISGKKTVGFIVTFPPSYGVYRTANGLDIKRKPIGGSLKIEKAKELAQRRLRVKK